MSLRELLEMYVPPLPSAPSLTDIMALASELKDDWNRMNERIDYENGKAARWRALRDRAAPPGRVEFQLAAPGEMVELRRVQAATVNLTNEYEAEKASRESYILDLRAKLKRASQHHENLASDIYRERGNANIWRHRADDAVSAHEFDRVLMSKDIEQGKAALAKLRGVQEELATARADAESLERGLAAAVEAATAQLREELAQARQYAAELITERDEAVASAERHKHTADLRALAAHGREQLREQLATAEQQRDTMAALLKVEQSKPSPLYEENEKLRKLSGEACAEREELREKLVKSEDERRHVARVANTCAEGLTVLRQIDAVLRLYLRDDYRARDVVKELCRLRGIST